jgi:hypothetical protein
MFLQYSNFLRGFVPPVLICMAGRTTSTAANHFAVFLNCLFWRARKRLIPMRVSKPIEVIARLDGSGTLMTLTLTSSNLNLPWVPGAKMPTVSKLVNNPP